MAPYLVDLVQQVQSTDATADFAALRLKEAGEYVTIADTRFTQSTILFCSVQGSGFVCI